MGMRTTTLEYAWDNIGSGLCPIITTLEISMPVFGLFVFCRIPRFWLSNGMQPSAETVAIRYS